MPGRQIYFQPPRDQGRRRHRDTELLQSYWMQLLLANQGYDARFFEQTPDFFLRNYAPLLPLNEPAFDLNFILRQDSERTEPQNVHLRTNRNHNGNEHVYSDAWPTGRSFQSLNSTQEYSNRYLLEYLRQMQSNYGAMQRELTMARALTSSMIRNANPNSRRTFDPKRLPEIGMRECPLTRKYGHSSSPCSRSQEKCIDPRKVRNQECDAKPSGEGCCVVRKNKGSPEKSQTTINSMKRTKGPAQIAEKREHSVQNNHGGICQPKTLKNSTTAVCSTHNVAVIFPQDSDGSFSHRNKVAPREIKGTSGTLDKSIATGDAFKSSDECSSCSKLQSTLIASNTTNEVSGKAPMMEACQRLDEKTYAPDASRCIDSDVKQEDRTQADFTINTIKSQRTKPSKEFANPISESKLASSALLSCLEVDSREKSLPSRGTKLLFEDKRANRKENCHVDHANRSFFNRRIRKCPYERIRPTNDSGRSFARGICKNVRSQKRMPIPRSTVHTAYNPMVHNFTYDPNGFTIQLLRLAVLLYAPALMPALNSLIARQNPQMPIPIPCFEGSNDLLNQVFRLLGSQQRIPNLPSVPSANPRSNECLNAASNPLNLPRNSNISQRRETALSNVPGSASPLLQFRENSEASKFVRQEHRSPQITRSFSDMRKRRTETKAILKVAPKFLTTKPPQCDRTQSVLRSQESGNGKFVSSMNIEISKPWSIRQLADDAANRESKEEESAEKDEED